MSDGNQSDGFATAGSGKSPEEVAFDLLNKLKGQGVWGERNIADILDMYAECLDATQGLRAYAGQKRIHTPTQTPQTAARPTQSVPTQQRAQPQAPIQAQPPAAAHAVHPQSPQGQQHTLQQAFNPGP